MVGSVVQVQKLNIFKTEQLQHKSAHLANTFDANNALHILRQLTERGWGRRIENRTDASIEMRTVMKPLSNLVVENWHLKTVSCS